MVGFLLFIDRLSAGVGKAFSWCIIVLTFGTCYEVFMRYILRAPTSWAFDVAYCMYGALFLMAGAYTLSRNGHVRGDVVYRLLPVKTQAGVDLALYVLFFFPGFLALLVWGYPYALTSFTIREVSIYSPAGMPIWPLKALIPTAAVFMLLQGVAEAIRCVICLRDGAWPQRLHDVEELESAILADEEARARLAEQHAAGGAAR
ncbi:MAG: TRAP transporter small permease subunit [Hyphomicrobiaceae bacterium]|nr:TRAP transporter small permease subunit [Hyphomicrobiaceae bacterium]